MGADTTTTYERVQVNHMTCQFLTSVNFLILLVWSSSASFTMSDTITIVLATFLRMVDFFILLITFYKLIDLLNCSWIVSTNH